MKKTYEYASFYFTVDLVPGWVEYEFVDDPNQDAPLTFVNEKDGVGALQISMATSKNREKFDINEQLKRDEQQNQKVAGYTLGGWMAYEYEITEDGKYVKRFYFTKPNLIVFVTYNCDLKNLNEKELHEVIIITRTIDVLGKS